MNVIFMGTPDFGVPTLESLIGSSNHKVVAVFTQRPKAKDRGMKVQLSPVHIKANAAGIPVYTPSTLKTIEAEELIAGIKADIIVVVAYGFIITKNILQLKKYGCINVHPSKLPKYRGAAPLQRTIINGDKESAVCIIRMDEGLDTGEILLQEEFLINSQITLPELSHKCAKLGADLVIEVLDNIDNLSAIKQSEIGVVYASKLTKEQGRINWEEAASKIDCQIRGMNPWPSAYFEFNGINIKVMEACVVDLDHQKPAGTLLDQAFTIACGKDALRLIRIQPENKSQMSGIDYLRGIRHNGHI